MPKINGGEKMTDNVNHPIHYLKAAVTIEPIELTARLDSCLGQALQYVMRAPFKGNTVEDLEKAVFYLRKWIEINDKRTSINLNVAVSELIHIFYRYQKNNDLLVCVLERLCSTEGIETFPVSIDHDGVSEAISEIEDQISALKDLQK